MEKLIHFFMKTVSRRNLIIIIAVLSIAIILLLVCWYLNKNGYLNKMQPDNISAQTSIKGPTVIIDPGHGGNEPGAINGNIFERDLTLAISLQVEKELKKKNIDYYMLRTTDTYMSLEDRVTTANDKACKLFISIHINSFQDSKQSGILTTYNPNSPIGKEIAEIMQSRISNIGMRDRNIMPRPNLYVLRNTDMPSLLLEIGFMSNKKDLKLLTDAKFQQKCAAQIVLGIDDIVSKYITAEEESSAKD